MSAKDKGGKRARWDSAQDVWLFLARYGLGLIGDGAYGVDLAKQNNLADHDQPRARRKCPINCVHDLLRRCHRRRVIEFTNSDAVSCGALRQRVVERAMLGRRGEDFIASLERPIREYGCHTFRGVAKQRNILGRRACEASDSASNLQLTIRIRRRTRQLVQAGGLLKGDFTIVFVNFPRTAETKFTNSGASSNSERT
jgi:hypothetical protein